MMMKATGSRDGFRSGAIRRALTLGCVVVSMIAAVPRATAQVNEPDAQSISLMRETLSRLQKRVTIEFDGQRLEDVVEFVETVSGADLEPLWINERRAVGLDPDAEVTLNAKDVSLLTLLEMIMSDVDRDLGFDASSWQFTRYGTFEFGPRERLNARKRIELYDIRDLLFAIPRFDQAPEFDLNAIFQAGGGQGGGGGQSPFQNQNDNSETVPYQDRVDELINLITLLVETEQWEVNGGDAATIREWNGNLIIRAPDYVHRQLIGNGWWPSQNQRARRDADGNRYVSFTGAFEFADVEFDTDREVTSEGTIAP